MTTKENLHRLVDALPDGPPREMYELLQQQLYVLSKIQRGLDVPDDECITMDEMKRRVASWHQKSFSPRVPETISNG